MFRKYYTKAQISFEFLIILGIGLTISLVLGSLFFSVSNVENSNLATSQINLIGNELISLGEQIYFRGNGNKIEYKASFPDGIVNMSIQHVNVGTYNISLINVSEIYSGSLREHIFISNYENLLFKCEVDCIRNAGNTTYHYVQDQFSPGPKTLSIRAKQDGVYIDFNR